jgi:acyl-CoA synthetase (AMP-forming)/AMP-acid ligase II
MTRAWDELVNGITTVIPATPWSASNTLELIERERVTVAQGVPTQWSLMLADPLFDRVDTSSLRMAASGSATVPPDLVRELKRRLGVPFVVRYTSTEASLTTGTQLDDPDEVVAHTVGVPASNVEVELVDDDGVAVPPGEVGTVKVRSAAVMRGYWEDAPRTAEVLSSDGWLLTGDLGRVDSHGNLVLVGRRNEMYVRGGYNVYPGEVEAVLGTHPAVARVAIVAVDDPVLGEIGLAAVVAAPGSAPTLDELRAWCRARVADYKAPDRLVLVDELPLTAMLKVDKSALVRALCSAVTKGTER